VFFFEALFTQESGKKFSRVKSNIADLKSACQQKKTQYVVLVIKKISK
jgi:hypothetical protein